MARNPSGSDTAGAARTGGRRRFSLRPLRDRRVSTPAPRPHEARSAPEPSKETITTPPEPEGGEAPHLPAWLRRLGYYGLALLLVAAATLLRWELSDVLRPTPFLVFYLAWVGAAAFGGLGPGLLATLASWFCVDLLFDTTPGQIGFADPTSLGRLAVLLLGGLAVGVVAEKMRRSRLRERRQGRELRTANAALREREQTLGGSEAALARAQALAHLASWEVDVGTKEVRGSRELYRLFGLEPNVTLDAYIEKFHPDDRWRVVKSIEAAIYEGQPYSIDYRIVPRPGEVRHVHAEGEVSRDQKGAPLTFFGTVQDITERKQAEEALRESEERLHLALGAARMGVWQWEVGTEHVAWSPELYTLLGYESGQVTPTHQAFRQRIHPQDVARWEQAIHRSMDRCEDYTCEFRVVWPDGSVHWVEARGKYAYARDASATEAMWMRGVLSDIESRKQAEETLRESEEKYRRIVETAAEGIVMANAEARIIFVNDRWSEIFGYSPAEAAHLTLFDLVFPEDAARMKERWDSRKRGREERYEFRFRRKDGSPVWILSSVAPRFGPAGEFLGTLVLNTDITGRKRMEEALRELNATLENKVAERTEELERRARQLQKLTLELSEAEERERQRVAEILHDDLQQVLAAAKFQLSRVGSGTARPEQSQEIVGKVREMLKDAIEKSRHLSHELSPAVLRHGDLAETLDWLAEQMLAKHGLTVRVETFGTVRTPSDVVHALVYRAAQELLFNVVKHAQVHEARLRLRRRGRYICLSVSDRGRGFDAQEVRETAGFGLLNIRERVTLLGGRTKIRSARGRGTTFRIIVPDAEPAADGAPTEPEPNGPAPDCSA